MSKRTSPREFEARAVSIHGDRYDYSRAGFYSMQSLLTIGCPEHGDFQQRALKHIYGGQGCPKCGERRKGQYGGEARRRNQRAKLENFGKRFVEKARGVHGDLYDYAKAEYRGIRRHVLISCPVHGEFSQSPDKHLQGRGCPFCGHKSAGEREVLEFIRGLGVEAESRDRSLIAPKEIDIHIPKAGLAVEYCGLYWHSTIKCDPAFARRRHIEKHRLCADAGVRLITIFEDEWLNRRDQVQAILSGALKRARSVHARDCVVSMDPDGRMFHEKHHIQGAPRKGVSWSLSLNGEVVACMTFSKAASQRGSDQWELLRYSSSRRVAGGASRLMMAFTRSEDPESIVSFSDNRYFDGGMYKALGFDLVGEIPPDYSVVMSGRRRVHKSLFKRKSIPARILELGLDMEFDPATDPRSESEVTREMDCGRIYDCGKRKWLWAR